MPRTPAAPPESPTPRQDVLDRLLQFQAHFGRFLWDATGIIALAFGLITLLGLFGLSQGAWTKWWVSLLRLNFGWGSAFIVVSLFAFGIYALRRSRHAMAIPWGRVVAFEIFAFLSLAVLALLSGNRLSSAEAGQWGGRIGWALSSLLAETIGKVWGGALLVFVWILTVLATFGLWKRIEQWALSENGERSASNQPEVTTSDTSAGISPTSLRSHASPSQKTGSSIRERPLPPEYRKNFKIPQREEKTIELRPRSERLPPLNLLGGEQNVRPDERTINQTAGLIEKTLAEFGIPAKVIGFRIGPTVTQYAVQPGFIRKGNEEDAQQMKVRVAQIASLQKDLALALAAERLRIEAPVPGRNYVGIEVPNGRSALVRLRPLLESEAFVRLNAPLAIALGRDVSGNPLVADLARMPHLLVAGTTGSGKSVCLISIAACLAMNNTPEELRMIMIDSKMVELIRFNGLPHLYGKVETDVQRILGVLRWVVVEMEHRYQLLEAAKARDIDTYNRRLQRRKDAQPLPRIVVMIDELADLMMSAPDQTEHNLVRLAQMARATGIHLVVATQRPSTDVVTGLIKANFPARIAFAVASSVDSRVILDTPGAENLLGRGDMLFLNPEVGNPIRAQGVMVTDQEIERIIAHWQKVTPLRETPPPWETLVNVPDDKTGDDVLLERAITLLKKEQRASASLLQRKLNIGYPRAARLLDQLEEMGVVGPALGGGRDREVLLEPDDEADANGVESI